jgi:hypothetical protein
LTEPRKGDICFYILVALQGVRRARRDLAEAIDRTPATLSSKPLVEGALKLLMGVSNALVRAAEEGGCDPSQYFLQEAVTD